MKADELIIDKIKDIARSTVPDGSEAILYGSRARGDARSDSDWDILILLNKDRLTQNDYDNVSYPFVMLGCNQPHPLHQEGMGNLPVHPFLRERE